MQTFAEGSAAAKTKKD